MKVITKKDYYVGRDGFETLPIIIPKGTELVSESYDTKRGKSYIWKLYYVNEFKEERMAFGYGTPIILSETDNFKIFDDLTTEGN